MWQIISVLVCVTLSVRGINVEPNQLTKHHTPDHHDHDHKGKDDHDHANDRPTSAKQKRNVDYYEPHPVLDVDYGQAQPAYYQHYQPPSSYYTEPPYTKKTHPTYRTTTTAYTQPPTYKTTTPSYTYPPTYSTTSYYPPTYKTTTYPPSTYSTTRYTPPTYQTTDRPHLNKLAYLTETFKDVKDTTVHNVRQLLGHLLPANPKSESAEVPYNNQGCGCGQQLVILEQALLQLEAELLEVKSFLAAKEATLLDGKTKVVKFVKKSKAVNGEDVSKNNEW